MKTSLSAQMSLARWLSSRPLLLDSSLTRPHLPLVHRFIFPNSTWVVILAQKSLGVYLSQTSFVNGEKLFNVSRPHRMDPAL
jgi:hypothetical protein